MHDGSVRGRAIRARLKGKRAAAISLTSIVDIAVIGPRRSAVAIFLASTFPGLLALADVLFHPLISLVEFFRVRINRFRSLGIRVPDVHRAAPA